MPVLNAKEIICKRTEKKYNRMTFCNLAGIENRLLLN
jgi:hypothetical protein